MQTSSSVTAFRKGLRKAIVASDAPDCAPVNIPTLGFLRLTQIIGNRRADPPIPAIIPVSSATWWRGVKEGRFPQPFKLGEKCTAWKVEDIRALVERLSQGGEHAA